jgi:cytochrome c
MLAILALLLATQAAPAKTAAQPITPLVGQISLGQRIANENCATCHAVGRRGLSPNPVAPKFRHLSRKYPIENLSEAFGEGILVGHSAMPEFEFAPDQVDGLLAYIKSIQAPRPRPKNKRR